MAGTSLAVVAERLNAVALPDNSGWMNRLQIKSSSTNRFYTVSQRRTDGEWHCNCPGWLSKKPNRPRKCHHMTAMLPTLKAAFPSAKTTEQPAANPVKRIGKN